MHTGGVEGWKKSKYEYRDQLEVRSETSSFLTWMLYKLLQELVATTPTSRDWNGIFISILVIASIIGRESSKPCFLIKVTWHLLHLSPGMVMLSVRLLPHKGVGHYEYRESITSDDLAKGRLRPNTLNASWIEGKRGWWESVVRGVCRINHVMIQQ